MADPTTELAEKMPVPTELLGYLAKSVPYYRRLGIRDIRDIPPASKSDLMGNMPDHISDQFQDLRQDISNLVVDRGPASAVVNNQLKPIPGIIIEQTTGTSGLPGRFPKTVSERTRLAQGIWKHRRLVDPQVSLKNFLPFVHLPFDRKEDQRIEHNPDPKQIWSVYVDAQRQNMRWIHAQPRLLVRHSKIFTDAGFEPMPRFLHVCETTGEWLRDTERQTIVDYFGCKVINQYGCIETWAIGYDDTGSGDIEVLSDNVYVELLDPKSLSPITNAGEVGLVAVTSRHLRLMPVVRYMNGDRGEWRYLNGRLRLRLHEDRQINMMLLNGKLVPGAGAARILMNIAFVKFGYLHFDYIQFVQTSEFKLTMRLAACEKGFGFFTELKKAAADIAFSDKPIELSYEELSGDALAVALNEKRALFVSRIKPAQS
jgi:phenylacetate-coenzyme A ligase PaaK-like adenylate-forming protein